MATVVHHRIVMYGRILRQLRESKGRGQAEVARSVGISPAQLARLEANQRGLYVEDFVSIVETLGEKPGNLLPNDLGAIGHLKPLIDRLAAVKPEFLQRVSTIIEKIVLLTDDMTAATLAASREQDGKSQRIPRPAAQPKGRR
jgi:transcriptional regulator with XRE-family HTH domain